MQRHLPVLAAEIKGRTRPSGPTRQGPLRHRQHRPQGHGGQRADPSSDHHRTRWPGKLVDTHRSLITLNSVWKSYGVAITLNTTTGVIAHNEVMYFIDPISQLRYRATPFANETRQGAYSLDPASTNRFAQGIAPTRAAAGTMTDTVTDAAEQREPPEGSARSPCTAAAPR